MEPQIIPGEKVVLLCCNRNLLRAAIKGDDALGKALQAEVAAEWNTFGKDILRYVLKILEKNPAQAPWWSYLIMDVGRTTVIGMCGYKGPPVEAGVVEIGYDMAPAYRNKGMATEAAQLLIQNAFLQGCHTIMAHTLAAENPSTSVLKKVGMRFVQEMDDPEVERIWQWTLEKEQLL
jgi:RimJ/RimL family protein N-acetyltransferase